MSNTIFSEAFQKLNASGIFARESWGINDFDAFYAVVDEVAEMQAAGTLVRGYVYYTILDMAYFRRTGVCHVIFNPRVPCVDGKFANVAVLTVEMGQEIADIFRSTGLKVEWDGVHDSMAVSLLQ